MVDRERDARGRQQRGCGFGAHPWGAMMEGVAEEEDKDGAAGRPFAWTGQRPGLPLVNV